MHNDNLYPTSSAFLPQEPLEQAEARDQEKGKVFDSFPLIQEVIDHFEERIKLRDSLKAIPVDLEEDTELYRRRHAVNDMLAAALHEEKTYLEELVKAYVTKQ